MNVRQLQQVAVTYTSRRASQVILCGGGILYVILLVALGANVREQSPRSTDLAPAFIALAFPACVVSFLLVSQAKWQFVDPRARLLPHYARPHIAALLVLAIVWLLVLPLAVAIVARLSPVGCLAFAIVSAASFTWALHANKAAPFLILGGLVFSLYLDDVRAFWVMRASVAAYFPLHLTLLATGWVAYVTWLVRLTRLNEESEDYDNSTQVQFGATTRIAQSQISRTMVRRRFANGLWKNGPSDRWHDHLINFRARTTIDRQRLFRYGFSALPAVFNGVWLAIVVLAVVSVTGWFKPGPARAAGFGALIPLLYMPAMASGMLLATRRARMPQELLLPLTREQFVDGMLAAVAKFAATSIISLVLVLPIGVALRPNLEMDTSAMLAAAIGFVAVQPYCFGVAVYSALYQSIFTRMIAIAVASAPILAAVNVATAFFAQHRLPAIIAIAFILTLGIVLIVKGRRKWLHLELG